MESTELKKPVLMAAMGHPITLLKLLERHVRGLIGKGGSLRDMAVTVAMILSWKMTSKEHVNPGITVKDE